MKGRRGALGQYHASMSNNRGHDFEEAIRQACLLYASQSRAKVEKTPEPFRVLEKREGGIFVEPLHRARPAGFSRHAGRRAQYHL